MASSHMKFKIRRSGDEFYVSFIAKNGETLGHTENYKRKASAVHCAEIIIDEAGEGEIDDET